MEEEKKLTPFRLLPVEDSFPWGSERWNLADLGWRDTMVRDGWLAGNTMGEMMETYLDRVVGDDVFEWYGQQFPFQIKYLSVDTRTPLMVCPSDEVAGPRFDSLGKEKLWYVADAAPDARFMLGLRKDTDAGTFYAACRQDAPEHLLNSVPVKAGQSFLIPSGTVHAVCGRATVLEISESSAMDFRLCWNGGDSPDFGLNLDEALDFIDYRRFPPEMLLGFRLEKGRAEPSPGIVRLASLPQFTASRISLSDALKTGREGLDSCVAYTCVGGSFILQLPFREEDGKADYLSVRKGETVLVPAEVEEFFLVPQEQGAELVEVLVEKRSGRED